MTKRVLLLYILLDISEALDSARHNILLQKLQKLVSALALDWFESYLSDRNQRVCVGDAVSETLS